MRPRYMRKHKVWTPPYSTAEADLTSVVRARSSGGSGGSTGVRDKYLILASDGLFEDMDLEAILGSMHRYDQYRAQTEAQAQGQNAADSSASTSSSAPPASSLSKGDGIILTQSHVHANNVEEKKMEMMRKHNLSTGSEGGER